MREILFRGKTEDGRWVEGVFLPDCLESLKNQQIHWGWIKRHWIDGVFSEVCTETVEVIRETVGQFTGSLDENGKKIFEGDIVKNTFEEGNIELLLVVWDEKYCRFELEEQKTKQRLELCFREESEVIGNIHDNPDLLEVER